MSKRSLSLIFLSSFRQTSFHHLVYFGYILFPPLLPPSDSQVSPSPTAAMNCRPPSRCHSSSGRETQSTNWTASSSLTGCSRSALACKFKADSHLMLIGRPLHPCFAICRVFCIFSSSSGVSLQEELGLERGQSGHPSSHSRAGLGCTAWHWGTGKL